MCSITDDLDFTSEDVLSLARGIIQHASQWIIEILATHNFPEMDEQSQLLFADTMQKMLEKYMTPTMLRNSQENINELTRQVRFCF